LAVIYFRLQLPAEARQIAPEWQRQIVAGKRKPRFLEGEYEVEKLYVFMGLLPSAR